MWGGRVMLHPTLAILKYGAEPDYGALRVIRRPSRLSQLCDKVLSTGYNVCLPPDIQHTPGTP